MRPNYVNNEQEYRISKFLFHKFLHSQTVLDAAEGNYKYINRIHMFFHQHVYVNEDLYLYYKRRHIRHFEVSHSSPHEVSKRFIGITIYFKKIDFGNFLIILFQGTNFGLKKHSAPMQPTMNLDTSSKTLNLQANLKAREVEEIIFNDYHYSHKTWSSLPTAPYTTTLAEGIINGIMKRSLLYGCKRLDTSEFEVEFLVGDEDQALEKEISDNSDIQTAPIPIFH